MTGPTKCSVQGWCHYHSLLLPPPASSSNLEQGCSVLCRDSMSPTAAQDSLYSGKKTINGKACFSFMFPILFLSFSKQQVGNASPPWPHPHQGPARTKCPPGRDPCNLHDGNCGLEPTSPAYLLLSLPTATTLFQVTFISPWTPTVASHLGSLPPLSTPCNSQSDLFKMSIGLCRFTVQDLFVPSHST